MGVLAWVVMGLALWHFSIWLPDRFLGGIVGALVGALLGGFISGVLIAGLTLPGRHDTHLSTPLEAIPGAIVGMALIWVIGGRRDRTNATAPVS